MVSIDKRLLVKIAYYYYRLGMTQEEIARKLSMSRQRVNRLSKKLIDEGIVKITISGYEDYYIDIENRLEEKFNLKQAIIIPRIEGLDLVKTLGAEGAQYLESVIEDNMTIGVSWGSTLSEVAANMQSKKKKNIAVVQLVGGMNLGDSSIKADEITRAIASGLDATPYLMYAPAFVKDISVKQAIKSDQSIINIFEKFKTCNIAVVGIGNLDENSTLFTQKYLEREDLEELKELGAVGDICSRYYDLEGNILNSSANSRVIGANMEELKSIGHVVGIAGGKEKVKAIYGALKGGHLNVLITDNITAEDVLSLG